MSNFKQDLQETIRCSTEQQKFIGNKEYIIDEYADKTSALVLQLIQNRLGIDASLFDLQWNMELYDVLIKILALRCAQLSSSLTGLTNQPIKDVFNESFDDMVNAIGLHLMAKTEQLNTLRGQYSPLFQAELLLYIKLFIAIIGFIFLIALSATLIGLEGVIPGSVCVLGGLLLPVGAIGIAGSIFIWGRSVVLASNNFDKEQTKIAAHLPPLTAIKDSSGEEKRETVPLYRYLNSATFFGNDSAPAADNGTRSLASSLTTH